VVTDVDWSKREESIREHHSIEPAWADEVVADEHAVWVRPDPASRSGYSVRVFGWSRSLREVLTVILVDCRVDPSELPRGDWWGRNAWVANERDRRLYGEEEL
jgi:hypothetical protein